MYTCPVCAYPQLNYPPCDFTICPSCGTEFGYHDATRTFEELRTKWMVDGMRWHSRAVPPPKDWSAVAQLLSGGYLPVITSSCSEEYLARGPMRLQSSWA